MPERKKKILAGVLFCLFFLGTGIYIMKKPPPLPAASVETAGVTGVIDLKKALAAHPRYAELQRLRAEQKLLQERQQEDKADFSNPSLVIDDKLFAARAGLLTQQKQKQRIAEYNKQLQAREQEIRRRLAPAWEAEKKAISEASQNAIFNANLKLENADNLRLSPKERQDVQDLINALKKERNDKIKAADIRFEKQIAAELEPFYTQLQTQLAQETEADRSQQTREAELLQKQAKEQDEKFSSARSAALQEVFAKGKNRDLESKEQEIAVLEDTMIKEIAGKAAKAAILHHLQVIFANPVAVVQAVDVTEEVTADLKLAGSK